MPHTRWGLAACSLLLIRHIYVNWGGFLSSRSWPAPSLSWCLLLHCSINWEPADKRERGTLELWACAHSLCQLSCLIKAHFGSPLIFGFWPGWWCQLQALTRATPGKSSPEYFSFVTQSQDNLRSPSLSWKLHYPWWHPAWSLSLPRLTSADGVTIVSDPGDTCPHALPGAKLGHGHHEWGGNVSQSWSASPGAVSRI